MIKMFLALFTFACVLAGEQFVAFGQEFDPTDTSVDSLTDSFVDRALDDVTSDTPLPADTAVNSTDELLEDNAETRATGEPTCETEESEWLELDTELGGKQGEGECGRLSDLELERSQPSR